MRKNRALLSLVIAALCVGSVLAAAVLIYDWSLTLTGATPVVRFIKWIDSSLYNTIDLPYNIYANMWTYDANATHGIKNTGGTAKTVDIYINTISDTSKVANVTVEVRSMNGVTLMAKSTWKTGDSVPTSKVSFSAAGNTGYIIRVWLKGAATVGAVTVGMKLEAAE